MKDELTSGFEGLLPGLARAAVTVARGAEDDRALARDAQSLWGVRGRPCLKGWCKFWQGLCWDSAQGLTSICPYVGQVGAASCASACGCWEAVELWALRHGPTSSGMNIQSLHAWFKSPLQITCWQHGPRVEPWCCCWQAA